MEGIGMRGPTLDLSIGRFVAYRLHNNNQFCALNNSSLGEHVISFMCVAGRLTHAAIWLAYWIRIRGIHMDVSG